MWNVLGHFNDFDFYGEYRWKILSRGLKFMCNFYFQFQYRNSELYITFGNIPVIFKMHRLNILYMCRKMKQLVI